MPQLLRFRRASHESSVIVRQASQKAKRITPRSSSSAPTVVVPSRFIARPHGHRKAPGHFLEYPLCRLYVSWSQR